jgi:manganese efflux pump family protein
MSLLEIIIVAIGLGTDTFSVGIAVGSTGISFRKSFRASFHFGLFQFFMPILGWLASSRLAGFLSDYSQYIAAALLVFVSLHMIKEFRENTQFDLTRDITRGWSLVSLSLATSIDAFGIGLGMGIIGDSLFIPSAVIGMIAAIMTLIGIQLGFRLAGKIGHKASLYGAIILIAIAVKMLLLD